MVTKEDILAGLELAISEVINTSKDRWVSVRELSIVKVLKEFSVNKNYSVAFMDVLKSHGLLETSGNRAGLMLRFSSTVIPDFAVLAREIYDKHKELSALKTKPSDLRPLKRKKEQEQQSSAVSTRRRFTMPNLGEPVFTVYDNKIRQAIVLGSKIDKLSSAPAKNRGLYYTIDVIIPLKKYANQAELFNDECLDKNVLQLSLSPREIFPSVQEAAEYLVRSSVLFPRDYIDIYK